MGRVLGAAVLAVGVLMLPAAPAAAHGDKIKLEVSGDGANGVTVLARHDDGHPIDDRILRLVLTATGDGGRRAGPVQLNPAAEGRGFYSSGAVLTPGRWNVVVTAAGPPAARAQATIETRPPQTALPAAATDPEGDEGADRDGGRTWWIIGLLVALTVVGGLVLAARRRSATPTGDS
ncbi:MAG TPA: hypothetical protein VFT95_14215 [Micromonosporaceae bacterium]|nr:hypothetical protein [Micromonosporaceae bacterium]